MSVLARTSAVTISRVWCMDQFIARENVKHFRRELENGADEQRRATLIRLLVEEENHLGLTGEQLSRLDRHIARLSEIMATNHACNTE